MRSLPEKLKDRLNKREADNALRTLVRTAGMVDFASNDYLGFARSNDLNLSISKYLKEHQYSMNGSTGSRLLSGNHLLHSKTEDYIATYHRCETALIFNSGYNANLGLLSSLPQREDLVIFDELTHASIRDGLAMSKAKHYKFRHNDLEDLKNVITRYQGRKENDSGIIYIITESVFSMDGDSPDLCALVKLCQAYNCLLIVDEAHAFGIFGETGQGLLEEMGIGDMVFARIITFGKAMGSHGAAVLGTEDLKNYLINYARSFIYTTALSPHSIASILMAYKRLESEQGREQKNTLKKLIHFFKAELQNFGLDTYFIPSFFCGPVLPDRGQHQGQNNC